jgi:hypothetical protein
MSRPERALSARTSLRSAVAPAILAVLLGAQALLLARLLHNGTNYDEGVYLAAVDAIRHGQELGTQVFAAQFPGFYDILRAAAAVGGATVPGIRAGFLAIFCLAVVGAWLIGRFHGGTPGAAITAGLFVVAPPLDLFGSQVIADTPALAFTLLAVGLATLGGPVAAVAAGVAFALGLSIKLTAVTALPALLWYLRRRALPALGGAAAVGLALLGLHADQLDSFWTSAVRYHELARSTPAVIPDPHRQIVDQIPRRTPFFWVAAASVVVAATDLVRRRRLETWPLWLWTALAVVFLLLHAPLHYNHLVLFPGVLAVSAGATIAGLSRRHAAVWAVCAMVLAAAYLQQWDRVNAARFPEPPSNVSAAKALARLTPRSAMTVDDRPTISFLAHRRVVGPLVDLAVLRFETGSLEDQQVIRKLGQASAVVISRSLRGHPRILAAVRRAFALRYDRGGVRIWVRR